MVWYTEGFDIASDRVLARRVEDLPKLCEFKAKWKSYVPPDWRYDVVRFSNKVYAVHDALRDFDGIGVWMDADILTHKPLPEGYLQNLLPEGHYIALFQRKGVHSETGLWVVDCRHKFHKPFMDALLNWYETGAFQNAHEWHDCIVMDSTIRAFQKLGLQAHNLSGEFDAYHHPMAKHPIARYLDHLKGPTRKALGKSPERA